MAFHDFTDTTGGEVLHLVIDNRPLGEHGVQHPDCTELASIRPDLNAFLCTTCGLEGHINGDWVRELWHAEATYAGGA